MSHCRIAHSVHARAQAWWAPGRRFMSLFVPNMSLFVPVGVLLMHLGHYNMSLICPYLSLICPYLSLICPYLSLICPYLSLICPYLSLICPYMSSLYRHCGHLVRVFLMCIGVLRHESALRRVHGRHSQAWSHFLSIVNVLFL